MPKRHVQILRANGNTIVLEGTIGSDYRLSIPKHLHGIITPETKVRITIEKL